ncbi:MFS transporter [Rhizocola hellebori]|uniref:MFS transporter n=1 Tax=Rhizocola hellebori TaxID=1392758 RepID=A0A8J3QIV6_9ACTN|nr:MFS transporter [Rhizocola hellebori]
MSVLGGSFAPVALAFGVLGLPGATAKTLSVVLAAQSVPMVAFMLFGGVIADRLPRQRVMMAGESMNTVAYLSLAAMFVSGWSPLPAMAAAAALSGIGMATLFPALIGLVPEVVPADQLQAANGLIGLGVNISRVLGVVAGGGAVVLLGSGWALVASASMFGLAAALISGLGRISPRRVTDGQKRQSVLTDLREGWQIFISKQWLWVVVAQFAVLVMALQAAHGVLGPVVAKQELGGAAAWSAALAAQTVGMIVGVVIAMRLRPRRPILVATLAMLLSALPYLTLGLSAPLWTLAIAFFLMGISHDIFGVLWNTTMQREIPPESLSRVSSYDALGSLMFGPIGLLVAGPVALAVGPKPALLGCAAIIVIVTLLALVSPDVRNLRAPAEAAAPPEELPVAVAVAGSDAR